MKVSFSIIVLTKDRNQFLKKAINSIQLQKKKPIEILVLDNSPSKTAKLLCSENKYSKKIKYFSLSKINNVAKLRNLLAKKAKGNYLAFLDDDDYWQKNYLSESTKIIKKNNIEFIITNIAGVKNKKKNKHTSFKKRKPLNIKDFLIINPGVFCSNVIINRSIFLKLGGFDPKVSGSCDKDLIIRILENNISYKINDKYLVNYSLHTNQWSSNPRKVIIQKLLFYLKYLRKYSIIEHLIMIKVLLSLIIQIFFRLRKFNSI
jgi:teichuronic acid biosynthesis glycosyltransferase TuaG